MDRVSNRALRAEVLHFEDVLREEMKELARGIADDPRSRRTQALREKCHALRIELLRMIQQFGYSDEENATQLRVMRLDADLDQLFSTHDRQFIGRYGRH